MFVGRGQVLFDFVTGTELWFPALACLWHQDAGTLRAAAGDLLPQRTLVQMSALQIGPVLVVPSRSCGISACLAIWKWHRTGQLLSQSLGVGDFLRRCKGNQVESATGTGIQTQHLGWSSEFGSHLFLPSPMSMGLVYYRLFIHTSCVEKILVVETQNAHTFRKDWRLSLMLG